MERKIITEDELKIKYIKQAIFSLKKDEEGFVDCMNIGKKLHLKGIQIEGKIGAIVQKNDDMKDLDEVILQKRMRYKSLASKVKELENKISTHPGEYQNLE